MTALGGTPAFYSGVLATQTARLLAGELDERARLPVIVIDEAHLLANTDLESLRMLTNTDMDTGSHFAMLLVGQPTLRRRLKLAVLAALDQRISTRYTVTGMSTKDTSDYVRHHLKFAGRSDPLFSDDAITAIHQAARGYPRAINNLAVAALIATYAAHKSIVDLPRRAIRDHREQPITPPSPVTTTTSPRRPNAPPTYPDGAFPPPPISTNDDAAIVKQRDG